MRSEPAGPAREVDEPALDRIFARYRAAFCGSTLLMVGLSWPLWVDDRRLPQGSVRPGRCPSLPPWVSWLILAGIVATLGLATVGSGWRLMLRISLPLLVFAILQDQNRFQPWAYQYRDDRPGDGLHLPRPGAPAGPLVRRSGSTSTRASRSSTPRSAESWGRHSCRPPSVRSGSRPGDWSESARTPGLPGDAGLRDRGGLAPGVPDDPTDRADRGDRAAHRR